MYYVEVCNTSDLKSTTTVATRVRIRQSYYWRRTPFLISEQQRDSDQLKNCNWWARWCKSSRKKFTSLKIIFVIDNVKTFKCSQRHLSKFKLNKQICLITVFTIVFGRGSLILPWLTQLRSLKPIPITASSIKFRIFQSRSKSTVRF